MSEFREDVFAAYDEGHAEADRRYKLMQRAKKKINYNLVYVNPYENCGDAEVTEAWEQGFTTYLHNKYLDNIWRIRE